ncbi:uncharacterized protein LOC121857250 isoform X1 [Homarus americanus]|uniref:uncharacterized protein LOC121857250 isoform X1 n=1 Tax=Homarus americanus TaxID=6706 RepID=UPI001C48EDA5|nr:uncharacterized protein LOC121857250 isoform X1 [Homarus americanus]
MDHNRYKQRGLQFNSAIDSRALRAVQYQEGRRTRRYDAIAYRRQLDNLDRVVDTEESLRNTSVLSKQNFGNKPKKTKKELPLERYENLLKWKEARKKNLAKEKKRRQPTFKTGVFQPDAPKFLVSSDIDMGASVTETPGKKPTFKFLVSSSRKAGRTPGSSMRKVPIFHTGVTPGTSMQRIPKFHSGVTPGVSGPKVSRSHTSVTPNEMQKRDRLLKLERNQENIGGLRTRASLRRAVKSEYKETEVKKSLRSRVTRRKKVVDEDDLGVKPLPASPAASQAPLPLSHEEAAPGVPSFAPNNFAFQFDMSNLPRGFDILAENNVARRSRHSFSALKNARGVDGSPDETSTNVTADTDTSSINQSKVHLENEEAVEKEVGKQRGNSESEDANVTETDSRYVVEAKPHTGQEEIDEVCKSVEQVEEHEAVENVEENKDVENVEENEDVENVEENEDVENVEENEDVENMGENEDEEKVEENEDVENEDEENVEERGVEASETVEEVHKFEEQEKFNKEQVQEDENNEDECIVEEKREKYEVEEQMGPMLTTNADDVAQVSVNGSNNSNNINAVKVDSGRNEDKSMPEEDADHEKCTSQEGSVDDTLDTGSIQEENKNGYRSKRRGNVATPAKRITRRSTACCGDDFVTPTISRLRPRTPCSRSTRRSISAHCDSPPEMMFTPRLRASAKKSSRRSENCVKLNHIDESLAERNIPTCSTFYPENTVLKKKDTCNEQTLDDKAQEHVTLEEKHTEKKFELPLTPTELETDSSLFVTPRSQLHESKLSWLLKTSPWIDNSRRSSNKKRNCSTPEFQRLPDDIVMSEYPVCGHPDGTRPDTPADQPVVEGVVEKDTSVGNSVFEDQTCTNLLALLKPSMPAALYTQSPDIDVWAEDSPAVSSVAINPPAVTPLTSKQSPPQITPASLSNHQASVSPKSTQETTTKSTLLSIENTPTVASVSPQCKENEEPHQSLSSDAAVFVRRKSRRSVMFAVQEEENATPSFRFPGTPIRSSSRVSMGIFAKIDMNTDYVPSQNEDLISLDSPQSEKKTTATRRKSSRMSLFHGMVNSRIIEQELPVTQDLISFDTPVEHKKRKSRSTASNLTTPSRRSRRLSKAPVL